MLLTAGQRTFVWNFLWQLTLPGLWEDHVFNQSDCFSSSLNKQTTKDLLFPLSLLYPFSDFRYIRCEGWRCLDSPASRVHIHVHAHTRSICWQAQLWTHLHTCTKCTRPTYIHTKQTLRPGMCHSGTVELNLFLQFMKKKQLLLPFLWDTKAVFVSSNSLGIVLFFLASVLFLCLYSSYFFKPLTCILSLLRAISHQYYFL